MKRNILLGPATMVLMLAVAVLPAAAAEDIAKSRKQLDAHLKQCTQRHGYNPEATADLGPHALGSGEREWRECVYQGVEKYLIRNTLTPEVYRKAIAEDREMTEKVAAGRMTRAERRARIEALLKEIDGHEEVNKVELERRMRDLDRQMQELRRQQEQMRLRELRRSVITPLGR